MHAVTGALGETASREGYDTQNSSTYNQITSVDCTMVVSTGDGMIRGKHKQIVAAATGRSRRQYMYYTYEHTAHKIGGQARQQTRIICTAVP